MSSVFDGGMKKSPRLQPSRPRLLLRVAFVEGRRDINFTIWRNARPAPGSLLQRSASLICESLNQVEQGCPGHAIAIRPIALGDLHLPNRVIMALLMRYRSADPAGDARLLHPGAPLRA
jgi:hypothetical protein